MKTTRRGLFARLAMGTAALAAIGLGLGFGPDDDVTPAKVGDKAPEFTLTDIDGKEHALAKYVEEGKTIVLEWFNPDCPVVAKYHQTNKAMRDTYRALKDRNVVWLAVNSGHEGHSSTGVDRNARAKKDWEIEYPILLDYSGKVGKSYGAKVTPQLVVIHGGKIVYNGALDETLHAGREIGKINYVIRAVEQAQAGETVEVSSNKATGCSIKYARGG